MVCCVIGPNASSVNFLRDEMHPFYLDYHSKLENEVKRLILLGCERFLTNVEDGCGMDFAEMVEMFKRRYDYLSLELVLPYPIKEPKVYTQYHENRYFILDICNRKHIISGRYSKGGKEKSRVFMVDASDIVLAVWDGKRRGIIWNTIKYARSKGKKIRYIMLNELNDFGMLSN